MIFWSTHLGSTCPTEADTCIKCKKKHISHSNSHTTIHKSTAIENHHESSKFQVEYPNKTESIKLLSLKETYKKNLFLLFEKISYENFTSPHSNHILPCQKEDDMCIHRIPIMCFHNILWDLHTYIYAFTHEFFCLLPNSRHMYHVPSTATRNGYDKNENCLSSGKKCALLTFPSFPNFSPLIDKTRRHFRWCASSMTKKSKSQQLLYCTPWHIKKSCMWLVGKSNKLFFHERQE